jgi:hypothetical protein
MQIPYDLEFVENRPAIEAHAIPMPEPVWRSVRAGNDRDAFDALLSWVHRMLSRLDGR